ncbi:bile acid:sodium symporter family protein [Bacillus cihuensis]|uniref:bile acid:sodium symporter family protein n=1 Tax=Bacillus cihuensis TaxID=1208599 RepID=UPI000409925E|nr:bile acid:sodium symporter family protein [Bacillus cihuensis]
MLQKLNAFLENKMPFITPISVLLGVMFASYVDSFSFLVPWLFAFMTFSGSLGSNIKSFKEVMIHPLPIIITMCILHVIMPIWAFGVGHVVFHGDVYTITGLILGMIIPTGITSVLWVSIYRGNIPLTLAVILIDTFLSPFIVPYTMSVMVGEKVEMDILGMMGGLLWMVVVPSLSGMMLNQVTKGKVKTVLGPRLSPISKFFLGIVVLLNSSVIAPYLRHVDAKLVFITIVVFLISFSGYLFSFLIGRLFKMDREDVVSLTFLGGMRNISTGAVIAISYFPAQVAVPVVIGMLFQQVLASSYGRFVDRYYKKRIVVKTKSA